MAEFNAISELPFNPLDLITKTPELQSLFSMLKNLALIILALYILEHLWKWLSERRQKRKINKILQDVEDIKLKLNEIENLLNKKTKNK